jgi:hypothetical protein
LPWTVVIVVLVTFPGPPARGQAPSSPASPGLPPVTQPTQQTQVVARATAPPAWYVPPPVNTAMFGPGFSPYWWGGPRWDPFGGGLTGAANAISAQGEFEKQFQEARLLNQEVERSKIDTRRKQLDQWLWERNNLPTLEDNRRRDQYEQLRRALNDPPPAEIWNGSALNRILAAIQQVPAPGAAGPTIPLDPSVMSRISLTGGAVSTGPGLLRNGPSLNWPLALQDDPFDKPRDTIDRLMKTAYDQVTAGAVDGKVLRQLTREFDQLDATLRDRIEEMTPTQNVQGRRFVRQLRDTVRALQQPGAHDALVASRSVAASTVTDLVQDMTARGLTFAPALAGAEPAYNALHSALVAYYNALTQPTIR